MKFISKHKFATFTVVMLVVIIVLVFALIRFLIPNSDVDEYGNRLEGISNYTIDDSKIDEMKDTIGKSEGVVSIDYMLEGRLVDIIIRVKDEVERDVAKSYADQTLTYFNDEQKKYYDIEVLISSDNDESEKYPIIGSKHKTKESFVWSNN